MPSGFRGRLNSLPVYVTWPIGALLLAGIIWLVVWRGSGEEYDQPWVELRCLKCDHTTRMSAKAYDGRLHDELPGGEVLVKGAKLKCPSCGERELKRDQSLPNDVVGPREQDEPDRDESSS